MNANYRADIDGLRALAIALVLIFHFFPEALPSGFCGVDIFFAISGYLISRGILSAQGKSFRFGDFYRRRVERLFPALLLTTAVTLVVGWYLLLPDEFRSLGQHALAGLGLVLNLLLLRQTGYFVALYSSKPLLHLWSLSVEEQFYLLWPPLLLMLAYFGKLNRRSLLLLALFSFASNFLTYDPDAQFYLPFGRFWEFALGAIALEVSPGQAARWGWVGLLLLMGGVYFSQAHSLYQPLFTLPLLIGTSWLLAAGERHPIARIFSKFKFLGRIS